MKQENPNWEERLINFYAEKFRRNPNDANFIINQYLQSVELMDVNHAVFKGIAKAANISHSELVKNIDKYNLISTLIKDSNLNTIYLEQYYQ